MFLFLFLCCLLPPLHLSISPSLSYKSNSSSTSNLELISVILMMWMLFLLANWSTFTLVLLLFLLSYFERQMYPSLFFFVHLWVTEYRVMTKESQQEKCASTQQKSIHKLKWVSKSVDEVLHYQHSIVNSSTPWRVWCFHVFFSAFSGCLKKLSDHWHTLGERKEGDGERKLVLLNYAKRNCSPKRAQTLWRLKPFFLL